MIKVLGNVPSGEKGDLNSSALFGQEQTLKRANFKEKAPPKRICFTNPLDLLSNNALVDRTGQI